MSGYPERDEGVLDGRTGPSRVAQEGLVSMASAQGLRGQTQ
jgi:hypothetical protein